MQSDESPATGPQSAASQSAAPPGRPRATTATPGNRSTSRLAAVQALYQQATLAVPLSRLLHEFHQHRLSASAQAADEGAQLKPADRHFFDDLVAGVLARQAELDQTIAGFLQDGWSIERLDRLMLQILRCGAYELLARPDVPRGAVISEYVDVARAFYPRPEAGFVNALLDRLGKKVRAD